MKFRIYLPWLNLNCLGVGLGDLWYADIFPAGGFSRLPAWFPVGIYCRVGHRRYWWRPQSLVTGRIHRTVG